jgi:hypothetical protein
MKLFCDVKDFACPASEPISSLPSLNEPLWIALADKVVPVAPLPPAAALAAAGSGSGLAYTTVESAAAQAICLKSIFGWI